MLENKGIALIIMVVLLLAGSFLGLAGIRRQDKLLNRLTLIFEAVIIAAFWGAYHFYDGNLWFFVFPVLLVLGGLAVGYAGSRKENDGMRTAGFIAAIVGGVWIAGQILTGSMASLPPLQG